MLNKWMNRFLPGDSIAHMGIIWNVVGFGLIGASGILLNLLISRFYSSDVLGVFNQVMAMYILAGQIGVFGMQTAAVYFTSTQAKCSQDAGCIFTSFLTVAAILGGVSSILFWRLAEPIGNYVYHSSHVAQGLRMAAPAIFFFSINKLSLGIMNGNRYMKAFSIFQGLRYLTIIFVVLVNILLGFPSLYMMYSFFIAECLVFFSSALFLFRRLGVQRPRRRIALEGVRFGAKSVIGGIIGELNTKVDILVLGIFCPDEIVGVYSYASLLAEGFFSLIVVFRSNINPMLAKLIHDRKKEAFQALLYQTVRKSMALSLAGGICILLLFSVMCRLLPDPGYWAAMPALTGILFCMIVASGAIVQGNLLTHCGHPEYDTMITTSAVLLNFGCNFLLIPQYGMLGAASATGVSYLYLIVAIYAAKQKVLSKAFEKE